MKGGSVKTEYYDRPSYRTVPSLMNTRPAAYIGTGITPMDKNQFALMMEYRWEDTIISVRRFFDHEHTKEKLIKELIEERQQIWYNHTGNMTVASHSKEGS